MLESARLKVERAEHHIRDVKRQFAAFVKKHPHRLRILPNPQTGKIDIKIDAGKEPPDSIALTVGDAIHNLRVALDHMTWEVIGRDGGTQNRYLKLPTGDSRVSFEATIKGIKTPSESLLGMFRSLEVFPGGKGSSLYDLHLMDNADKHTVLNPVVQFTKVRLVIRNPDGSAFATFDNAAVRGSPNFIGGIAPGQWVEVDDHTKTTPDIFFREVEGAPLKPIIPTLAQHAKLVSETLDLVADALR